MQKRRKKGKKSLSDKKYNLETEKMRKTDFIFVKTEKRVKIKVRLNRNKPTMPWS